MNKGDLLQKELSNLYAINKQIKTHFDGSKISFLTEQNQLNVMEYIGLTLQVEEEVSNALNRLKFNPANTTDSIIKEISENLSFIVDEEIGKEIKEQAYLMSINRLIGYQISNLENVLFMGDAEKMINELEGFGESLTHIKKKFRSKHR